MGNTQINPALLPYIQPIANFDPTMYGGLGLGKIARDARLDLSQIRGGKDISQIAGFAGPLGAIKAAYAAQNRTALRNLAMNPSIAIEHPELVAAQQAEYERGANQDQGNTIAGAASDFVNRQQDVFQRGYSDAMGRRLQAAGLKLGALQGAGNLAANSLQQKSPGILSRILGGGLGAAAGFLTGGPAGAVIGGAGGALNPGASPGLGGYSMNARPMTPDSFSDLNPFKKIGSKFGKSTASLLNPKGSNSYFSNPSAGIGATSIPNLPSTGGLGDLGDFNNPQKPFSYGFRPQPYYA